MSELKNFVSSIDVENNKSWVRWVSLPKLIVLDEVVLGLFDESFLSRNWGEEGSCSVERNEKFDQLIVRNSWGENLNIGHQYCAKKYEVCEKRCSGFRKWEDLENQSLMSSSSSSSSSCKSYHPQLFVVLKGHRFPWNLGWYGMSLM